MPENNQMMSLEGQLVGMPLAGPESFSQQQLDYLKRALGVDETVLYEDPNNYGVNSCTLREAATNFEYIDLIVGYPGLSNGINYVRIPSSTSYLHFTYQAGNGATDYFARVYGTLVDTEMNITHCKMMYSQYSSTSADAIRNDYANDMKCIYKVVGVHRIAGGN